VHTVGDLNRVVNALAPSRRGLQGFRRLWEIAGIYPTINQLFDHAYELDLFSYPEPVDQIAVNLALAWAVKHNEMSLVEALMDRASNGPDQDGFEFAFIVAVADNQPVVADMLLADPDRTPSQDCINQAFQVCAAGNVVDMARRLLDAHPPTMQAARNGLESAMDGNHAIMVDFLLSNYPFPQDVINAALVRATAKNQPWMVDVLLSQFEHQPDQIGLRAALATMCTPEVRQRILFNPVIEVDQDAIDEAYGTAACYGDRQTMVMMAKEDMHPTPEGYASAIAGAEACANKNMIAFIEADEEEANNAAF
jgi:hypothetical protein